MSKTRYVAVIEIRGFYDDYCRCGLGLLRWVFEFACGSDGRLGVGGKTWIAVSERFSTKMA